GASAEPCYRHKERRGSETPPYSRSNPRGARVPPQCTSAHAREGLGEELQIRGVLCLLAGGGDDLLLEGVLGGAGLVLVVNAELPGPGLGGELHGGELVGRVVTELVLGRAVVFLQLDGRPGAALAGHGTVEGAVEELDALGEDLDD